MVDIAVRCRCLYRRYSRYAIGQYSINNTPLDDSWSLFYYCYDLSGKRKFIAEIEIGNNRVVFAYPVWFGAIVLCVICCQCAARLMGIIYSNCQNSLVWNVTERIPCIRMQKGFGWISSSAGQWMYSRAYSKWKQIFFEESVAFEAILPKTMKSEQSCPASINKKSNCMELLILFLLSIASGFSSLRIYRNAIQTPMTFYDVNDSSSLYPHPQRIELQRRKAKKNKNAHRHIMTSAFAELVLTLANVICDQKRKCFHP